MIAGIILFIGIILLVLVHEFGHFIAAKQGGIKVEEFGVGFPPRAKGFQRGETLYSLNWLPIGGFVRLYGENKHRLEELAKEKGEVIEVKRTFFGQSIWRRFVVVAAGISINFIVGWLLLSLVYSIGDRQRVVITEIQEGSPAAVVGLAENDELPAFKSAEDFVSFTRAHPGEKIMIEVKREGETLTKTATLRVNPKEGEGALGAAVSDFGLERLPIHKAFLKGFTDSVGMVGEIFKAFGRLLFGLVSHAELPADVVGPVGIFSVAGEFGKLGFIYILQLIAMISLNLAALNALPIPALDGGRILFLIIEKIKGSPIGPKREMWASLISFSLLIILMLIITGRDVVRLF